MFDYEALKNEIEGLMIEDNPALVLQKSRDFYWYSPVLKRQLEKVTAQIVVSPRSEGEVIRTLRAAYAQGIPVTPRGAGTGNYGQAMPLSGGILLNLAQFNKVKEIHPGRVVAEPGVIIAELDQQTRAHSGQELRFHPSTAQTATLGGFVAGGSGGVGSITWGGLRDLGNILRLRLVTMEAEPRVLDLKGWDLQKATHAYGTNGIITEVEMPLAPAYEWVDVLIGYDEFMACVRFADVLAHSNGILVKEIAPIAAPAPYDYFNRHKSYLKEGQSIVVVMVAPHSMDAFFALVSQQKGEVLFRSDTAEPVRGLPHAYELGWNHTTLRALKVDPTITYLQVQYPGPNHVAKVDATTKYFGNEVIGHLEFMRFDGAVQCGGLPLVRFTTEARLDEIIRIYEDHGCAIFNPHRYTLEEGGMKRTDRIQLDFKKMTDPKGLLNPGKMIAWENPNFDFKSGNNYLFKGLSELMEV